MAAFLSLAAFHLTSRVAEPAAWARHLRLCSSANAVTGQGLGEVSAANAAGNPVLCAVVVFPMALPRWQSHLLSAPLSLYEAEALWNDLLRGKVAKSRISSTIAGVRLLTQMRPRRYGTFDYFLVGKRFCILLSLLILVTNESS